MYKDYINQRKKDFDAASEFAKNEAANIRTGRATPALVEDVQIEYLGAKLRIKEVATISVPEPRMVVIQPWDKGALPAIEKGIRDSSLGLNPSSDSQAVRLVIPPLTEERRREFIRALHQKIEEARIRVRKIREDVLKKVQSEVREKKAREDDMHKAKEELQRIVDDLHKKFDEIIKKKEQELLQS